MPSRVIRDGVLDSQRYHDIDKPARLAFLELLLCADDYGLVPLSDVYLKRHTTAFEAVPRAAADAMLGALIEVDLLRMYDISGARFGFIPRFGNTPRATKAKWPLPPNEPAFSSVHALLGIGSASRRVWFYTYRVTHIPTGRYYLGSRSSTKPPADDVYYGSGAASKWLAANRQDCRREILGEHDTIDAARAAEAIAVASALSDAACLNAVPVAISIRDKDLAPKLQTELMRSHSDAPETETETETETVEKTGQLTLASARPKAAAASIPCPHLLVLELWSEVLPAMPQHKPALWRGSRADHLRARWRETAVEKGWRSEADGLAFLRKLFGYVGRSPFLTGRAGSRDGRPAFQAELDWLVRPQSWAKVIEGKYHEEAA